MICEKEIFRDSSGEALLAQQHRFILIHLFLLKHLLYAVCGRPLGGYPAYLPGEPPELLGREVLTVACAG